MRETILIGLAGRKHSGKSTVGGLMYEWAEDNGYKPEIRGFAWLLKLSFARIFLPDATVEEAVKYCDWFKETGFVTSSAPCYDVELFHRLGPGVMPGRKVLQRYGTEAHRDVFGSDFWVDALLPISEHVGGNMDGAGFSSDSDFRIITDVRFPNEALRINNLGGRVYEVRRPELEDNEDDHASEAPLSEDIIADYIENDAELELLQAKVIDELVWIHRYEIDSSTRA